MDTLAFFLGRIRRKEGKYWLTTGCELIEMTSNCQKHVTSHVRSPGSPAKILIDYDPRPTHRDVWSVSHLGPSGLNEESPDP